jgi:hypothetical protein
MPQEIVKQLHDRPPVPVAEMAAGPEESRGDSIRRARGAFDLAQEVNSGL